MRVRVDASDDGKGWMIYQLKDADGDDEPHNRAVLRYGSKAWDRAMRSRPPYYKEADGLITAATDARYYAEATEFPLLIYTDHAPLQYIKTCAKGPVTGWRIENLMGMPYEVKYLPGPKNIEADARCRATPCWDHASLTVLVSTTP